MRFYLWSSALGLRASKVLIDFPCGFPLPLHILPAPWFSVTMFPLPSRIINHCQDILVTDHLPIFSGCIFFYRQQILRYICQSGTSHIWNMHCVSKIPSKPSAGLKLPVFPKAYSVGKQLGWARLRIIEFSFSYVHKSTEV